VQGVRKCIPLCTAQHAARVDAGAVIRPPQELTAQIGQGERVHAVAAAEVDRTGTEQTCVGRSRYESPVAEEPARRGLLYAADTFSVD
jgi:hypothetical protein